MIRSILLALVAAHLASPMLPVHAAAPKVFSAEASLVRSDIVQGPVINASGTAVAWITGNPGDNTQIKTHKPAGIFHISTRDKTASFSQIARAYDPVWSCLKIGHTARHLTPGHRSLMPIFGMIHSGHFTR